VVVAAIGKEWFPHRLGERVDSFNLPEFKREMEALMEKGHLHLALELEQTKFLSIPSIQLLVGWADQLQALGGRLMLVAPSEKLRRQIAIFGSLDRMIVMKPWELPKAKPTAESPALDASPGS
jgi:anti-anti-sigma factor